jgi:hypothetical protein
MIKAQRKEIQPLPLFDSLAHINKESSESLTPKHPKDFEKALSFLKSYTGSLGTFNSYRREVERLLQWSWHIADKSLKDINREDIENFARFCQKPPKNCIGIKKAPRFNGMERHRTPNPEWRPFVTTISKREFKKGEKLE